MKKKVICILFFIALVIPCIILLQGCGKNKIVGFKVYIDNKEYSTENNTMVFNYGETKNWQDRITVYAVYKDKTEVQVFQEDTGYTLAMNPRKVIITADTYKISVFYGDFDSIDITMIVNKLVVDKPVVLENLVYDGSEITGIIYNDTLGYRLASGVAKATEAGKYTAVFALDANHKWSDGTDGQYVVSWSISKIPVQEPIIPSMVYTGSELVPDVPDGDLYKVIKNEGGIRAGRYDVVLRLNDSKNYCFASDLSQKGSTITLDFNITQAPNEFTSELTIENWSYNQTPKNPHIDSKFGLPKYKYCNTENGEYTSTIPTLAGTYYVKGYVSESVNYAGIESEPIQFKIEKNFITIPTIPSKTYNGSLQKATILSNDSFDVITNEGGIDAGRYDVEICLVDSNNYYFSNDPTKESLTTIVDFYITQADNSFTSEFTMRNWTYGSTAQTPKVSSKMGTPYFVYSNQENGVYVLDKPVNAGIYYVKAVVDETTNYKKLESEPIDFQIYKASVRIPGIASKSYTGEHLKATIQQNAAYDIENEGGVNVGNYDVILTLKDSVNYYFQNDSTKQKTSVTLIFSITKVDNSFLSEFTYRGWTYGETPRTPNVAVKMGTLIFKYSETENGEYFLTQPTDAGTYYIKAIVEETDNYNGIESEPIEFTIQKARIVMPESFSKEYTGKHLVADAEESDLYEVINEGGVDVGTYEVTLTLVDSKNYYFSLDTTKQQISITLPFTIIQAQNEFTTKIVIADIEYGNEVNPTITVKFGTPIFEYSTDEFGYFTTEIPTEIGTYFVRARVEGTDNYNSITSEVVSFNIV